MSRYTASEITQLPRATLIKYIERQPEVLFPVKICSRPVDKMEKKHLIRALTGRYGYVKAPVVQSSALVAGSISSEVVGLSRGSESPQPQALLSDKEQHSVQQQDPENDVDGAIILPDHVPWGELASSLEGGEESSIASDQQSSGRSPSPMSDQQSSGRSPSPMSDQQSSGRSPSHMSDQQSSGRSPSHMSDQQSSGQSPSPMSATPSSSVPSSPMLSSSVALTRHIIEGYEEETRPSDEDLLKDYVRRNERLAKVVLDFKSHKKKRQTDAALVRHYKSAVQIFDLLWLRKWENDRRILKKSIYEYLGLSASWFTKARQVTELLDKIGPQSPNPDLLVLQRMSSGMTTGKGKDIHDFLQSRAKAAGYL